VVFTSGIVDACPARVGLVVLSRAVGLSGYSCLTLVGVGSSTLLGPEESAVAAREGWWLGFLDALLCLVSPVW
jgi:hypothetical protein